MFNTHDNVLSFVNGILDYIEMCQTRCISCSVFCWNNTTYSCYVTIGKAVVILITIVGCRVYSSMFISIIMRVDNFQLPIQV